MRRKSTVWGFVSESQISFLDHPIKETAQTEPDHNKDSPPFVQKEVGWALTRMESGTGYRPVRRGFSLLCEGFQLNGSPMRSGCLQVVSADAEDAPGFGDAMI
jgi:hypothetical protein